MEWVQPQPLSKKLNLFDLQYGEWKAGGGTVEFFLPSVTQLLEELSSLVSKAHKQGERKNKKTLPALPFPCSM